jgi:hypothetical protein
MPYVPPIKIDPATNCSIKFTSYFSFNTSYFGNRFLDFEDGTLSVNKFALENVYSFGNFMVETNAMWFPLTLNFPFAKSVPVNNDKVSGKNNISIEQLRFLDDRFTLQLDFFASLFPCPAFLAFHFDKNTAIDISYIHMEHTSDLFMLEFEKGLYSNERRLISPTLKFINSDISRYRHLLRLFTENESFDLVFNIRAGTSTGNQGLLVLKSASNVLPQGEMDSFNEYFKEFVAFSTFTIQNLQVTESINVKALYNVSMQNLIAYYNSKVNTSSLFQVKMNETFHISNSQVLKAPLSCSWNNIDANVTLALENSFRNGSIYFGASFDVQSELIEETISKNLFSSSILKCDSPLQEFELPHFVWEDSLTPISHQMDVKANSTTSEISIDLAGTFSNKKTNTSYVNVVLLPVNVFLMSESSGSLLPFAEFALEEMSFRYELFSRDITLRRFYYGTVSAKVKLLLEALDWVTKVTSDQTLLFSTDGVRMLKMGIPSVAKQTFDKNFASIFQSIRFTGAQNSFIYFDLNLLSTSTGLNHLLPPNYEILVRMDMSEILLNIAYIGTPLATKEEVLLVNSETPFPSFCYFHMKNNHPMMFRYHGNETEERKAEINNSLELGFNFPRTDVVHDLFSVALEDNVKGVSLYCYFMKHLALVPFEGNHIQVSLMSKFLTEVVLISLPSSRQCSTKTLASTLNAELSQHLSTLDNSNSTIRVHTASHSADITNVESIFSFSFYNVFSQVPEIENVNRFQVIIGPLDLKMRLASLDETLGYFKTDELKLDVLVDNRLNLLGISIPNATESFTFTINAGMHLQEISTARDVIDAIQKYLYTGSFNNIEIVGNAGRDGYVISVEHLPLKEIRLFWAKCWGSIGVAEARKLFGTAEERRNMILGNIVKVYTKDNVVDLPCLVPSLCVVEAKDLLDKREFGELLDIGLYIDAKEFIRKIEAYLSSYIWSIADKIVGRVKSVQIQIDIPRITADISLNENHELVTFATIEKPIVLLMERKKRISNEPFYVNVTLRDVDLYKTFDYLIPFKQDHPIANSMVHSTLLIDGGGGVELEKLQTVYALSNRYTVHNLASTLFFELNALNLYISNAMHTSNIFDFNVYGIKSVTKSQMIFMANVSLESFVPLSIDIYKFGVKVYYEGHLVTRMRYQLETPDAVFYTLKAGWNGHVLLDCIFDISDKTNEFMAMMFLRKEMRVDFAITFNDFEVKFPLFYKERRISSDVKHNVPISGIYKTVYSLLSAQMKTVELPIKLFVGRMNPLDVYIREVNIELAAKQHSKYYSDVAVAHVPLRSKTNLDFTNRRIDPRKHETFPFKLNVKFEMQKLLQYGIALPFEIFLDMMVSSSGCAVAHGHFAFHVLKPEFQDSDMYKDHFFPKYEDPLDDTFLIDMPIKKTVSAEDVPRPYELRGIQDPCNIYSSCSPMKLEVPLRKIIPQETLFELSERVNLHTSFVLSMDVVNPQENPIEVLFIDQKNMTLIIERSSIYQGLYNMYTVTMILPDTKVSRSFFVSGGLKDYKLELRYNSGDYVFTCRFWYAVDAAGHGMQNIKKHIKFIVNFNELLPRSQYQMQVKKGIHNMPGFYLQSQQLSISNGKLWYVKPRLQNSVLLYNSSMPFRFYERSTLYIQIRDSCSYPLELDQYDMEDLTMEISSQEYKATVFDVSHLKQKGFLKIELKADQPGRYNVKISFVYFGRRYRRTIGTFQVI